MLQLVTLYQCSKAACTWQQTVPTSGTEEPGSLLRALLEDVCRHIQAVQLTEEHLDQTHCDKPSAVRYSALTIPASGRNQEYSPSPRAEILKMVKSSMFFFYNLSALAMYLLPIRGTRLDRSGAPGSRSGGYSHAPGGGVSPA